ncbi:MAG: lipoyl(octanoyl) transferase LipB [Thalassolituus sp.]|uniref:Octanoyltransferase n=2 Tax=root TaxID=1 RepID=M5E759_9GAMM|nr:lipoyl(octanoyl) transferase LipB [Thalassolituus oleivorans]PHQ83980.1 MAG: lipoyl(octanoyl) transferase LipB [Thalassobium sp.]AHK15037.1 lipoate-protein ligase B [Thalassolituus oleivorans R6-15]APR66160.1 octanoyltransferase [Thalassolituus oleivorans]MBQ0727209.1 lipoyl(octanoyl) transferase LipB [Thalassolituus oleivorans]MCA6128207.1 lipoate--protein ligase [Thalassolituus oleivorans 4BN06-13]
MRIRQLGLCDYQSVYDDMVATTESRDANSADELWFLQHFPVFTQGQAGKAEHVLMAGDIPVIQTDRGGQVTYHGPGQLVVYLLIDIKRKVWGPRQLVAAIERALVACLADLGIESAPREDAPGVYVGVKKIASLGLRIRNGRSFHGLSLNINMDLQPFQRINPCGYAGMEMTQIVDEIAASSSGSDDIDFDTVSENLQRHLLRELTSSNGIAVTSAEEPGEENER